MGYVRELFKTWFGEMPEMDRSGGPYDIRSGISGSLPGWQNGKPRWPTDDVVVMTRDGYRKCVTAFACINIIADAVAEATIRVYADKGQGKQDEIPDHPLRQLMQRPSPDKSEAELLNLMIRTAAIASVCVVEKVRSSQGNVVQLGRFDPRWIRPILRDGAPPDWEYTVPGRSAVVVPAQDVITFTWLDSLAVDDVTGDTPLRAILREAAIGNDLTDFTKQLLESGGIPPFVLVAEGADPDGGPVERLTSEEIDAIRAQFVGRYGGYRNWTGPAVIDGLRVERVGLDLNQLAFKDLKDGLDLKVCQAFRVPAPLIQVMAGLTTSYGKTLEESMTLLQMYTAEPLRTRLDGALTRSLLPEFDTRPGISLQFDTSDVAALQEDEDAVHTRSREDLKAGIISLDESRQRVGEEPYGTELGRAHFLPFSVVATLPDAPIDVPAPAPATTPPPVDPNADPEAEAIEDEARAWGTRQLGMLTPNRGGRRYIDPVTMDQREVRRRVNIARANRRATLQLAKLAAPKIRSYFEAQRDRIIATITSERAQVLIETRDVNAVIDWQTENEVLRQVLNLWWQQVSETAYGQAMAALGTEITWDIANPYLQYLMGILGKRIVGINETTQLAVETVVRDALLQGTSMPELADKLNSLFDETYANRHLTVARTESQVAYNLMSERAYIESGVVAEMQLADNPDHTTDPGSDGMTCSERNGMTVALGNVRQHSEGTHPNCIMCVIPVLKAPLAEGA